MGDAVIRPGGRIAIAICDLLWMKKSMSDSDLKVLTAYNHPDCYWSKSLLQNHNFKSSFILLVFVNKSKKALLALFLALTLKWNESGFRPSLCTYRLNWARRTSWGWWDDWDDTVLQTQDSKFEPWRSPQTTLPQSTLPLGHGGSPQYYFFQCWDRHYPSKHDTLKQWCFNVGPGSQTLSQH